MEILFRSIAQYAGPILLALCVFNLVVAAGMVRIARRQTEATRGIRALLKHSSGEDLEPVLQRHFHERELLQDEISALRARTAELEGRLAESKRHLGLVRYDAFEDVAGAQSFALALYDDQGNGAILNGVVGRNDGRVYCKPLVNGRSERNLSQEEQRAIREAREPGSRTIVSS